MDGQTVVLLVVVVLVVYSISLHELAHAYSATWCGDPTPGLHGRLSWNPLVHLHPFYSIALPFISWLLFHVPFGFAFTPIDPARFRHPLRDRALVGLAGPAANFLVGGFFIGLLWIPQLARAESYNLSIFTLAAFWNLVLGVFNLLPLPGLDGYDVVRPALPLSIRRPLDHVRTMGFLPMLLILFLGPSVFQYVFGPFASAFLRVVPMRADEFVRLMSSPG